MPLLNDEEYTGYLSRNLSKSGARAMAERARLSPDVPQGFSFGEQVRAGFRQENLFLTHIAPLFKQETTFAPEEGFDPREHLGPYAKLTGKFPNLLDARSLAELSHQKNEIDDEARDREILEGMGFGRSLAVFLPANLLSPENFIPIGAAARTAFGIGSAGTRAVLRSTALTGGEAIVTSAFAEILLQQKQGLRTTEESVYNVVGAGIFGSLLGSVGGVLGSAHRTALKSLAGEENVAQVLVSAEKAFAEATKPGTGLRLKLDNLQASTLKQTPRESNDFFDIFNEGVGQSAEDPGRGLLLEFLGEHNPRLQKLLKNDSAMGKLIAKTLFLTPAARLARSPVQEGRLFGGMLTRHFLTEESRGGPSIESLLELSAVGLYRLRNDMQDTYNPHRAAFRKLDVGEDEFWSMVGYAGERGDRVLMDVPTYRQGVEVDPFLKIRGNAEAIAVVEQVAQQNRAFLDVVSKTADRVGALTRSEAQQSSAARILSQLERSYLPRMINHDVALARRGQFREQLGRAYEERRTQLLPEFTEEFAAAKAEAESASTPEMKTFWNDQADELEGWVNRMEDPDDFKNIVFAVEENYLGPSSSTPATQRSLEARVNNIDTRWIEEYLVRDARAIQGRLVRSVLPDLILSDQWDRQLGGSRPLQADLAKNLEGIHERVRQAQEGLDEAEAQSIARDMEDLLDDAQELTLTQQTRLLRDLESAGVDPDLRVTMDDIHELVKIRKAERRTQSRLRADRANRKSLRKFAEGDMKKSLDEEIAALTGRIEESIEEFKLATEPLQKLARAIGQQVGGSERSRALGFGSLRFTDSRLSLKGTLSQDDLLARLGALDRMVHSQVSEARGRVFKMNVDTEHLERSIERGYDRDGKLSKNQFPGKARMLDKQKAKDIDSVQTEVLRLRNRHGAGTGQGFFPRNSKRLRDLNYITKMGSVLLSSIPDMAMAISTGGFRNYANSMKEFLTKQMFNKANRTDMQDWVRAAELYTEFGRHERLFGVDDVVAPELATRFDRGLAGATKVFTKMTMLDKWNAAHKMIAAQAIESRMVKTILSENPRKMDTQMLRFFGIDENDVPALRKQLLKHHELKRGLGFSNSGDWKNRSLRMKWAAAILKGTNDTIITPSAGDLPRFATSHPLGRMIFQFRNFHVSAAQRHLIPGLQRVFQQGDMAPAMTMGMLSFMGMTVYAANEWMKGRDPFRETVDPETGQNKGFTRRLILEGVDRGGAFGIFSELTSTALKLSGLGGLAGEGPSRFQSRNALGAAAGPAFGMLQDMQQSISGIFRDDFTSSDAARLRRLLPMQNLLWLRLLLDVGPNMPNAGTSRYFDEFLTAEQRLSGFEPEEVRR